MHIVLLLCDPAKPTLERATVESLRNAWGGGDATWLNPGVAAEFPVAVMPANRWDVWESLQGIGIDLCIVPVEHRRKRLLLADMDSTMIRQECIDELAAEAGVGVHVAAITARAMNGELAFEAALQERVLLLKGLPETVIERVFMNRIAMMPGGRTLVTTMRAGGARTALVSGGFTAFTTRVAEALGFDEHRANILETADGHLTGTVTEPILGRAAKVQALEDITGQMGLTPADAIAVGDGSNDLGMLGQAGIGVALHAKPVVQAECDLRINHGDLTALLYLQGYSVNDFVE